MARGKSLKIYLMDGTANGRWECTLAGRTTKAFKIPRKRYKDCSDLDELKKPAVYLLFGEDDDFGHAVYVGETEDAYVRLGNHVDNKDFWTEVIIFISQDDHFNKAHVKYLESRLYEIAKDADRYTLNNGTVPKPASIAVDERDEMEDFIDNVKIMTTALGHKVFEPVLREKTDGEAADDAEYYYLKSGNADATMVRTEEGYVVLKGSTIRLGHDTKSTPAGMIKRRDRLIADGTIADGIFTKNYLFASPSAASDLITARSTSGPRTWKNKSGVTLGEVLSQEENK